MNRKAQDNRIVDRIRINAGQVATLAKKKLRARGGFTLAETLLAVLILLLVSVIVATGMPAATNAYNKVILGANAKTMLSTAVTALHDEIGTAWRVEPGKKNNGTDDPTKLSYFNASTGAKSTISLDTEGNNAIQVQDYQPLLKEDDLIHDKEVTGFKTGAPRHLVSDSTAGMYVTYTSIGYDDSTGIVTIAGLKVCKNDADSTVLAEFSGADGKPKDFTIRVISKDLKEENT